MPVFVYQATDRFGKVINGTIEAGEKHEVVKILRRQKFLPIRIDQEKQSFAAFLNASWANPFKEANSKDILIFTHQLSTLLKASLTLDHSLQIIVDLTEKEKFSDIVKNVRKNVHGGSTFADALAKYPKIFSKLFVNMIKAGEAGGVLSVVVDRVSEFMEKTQNLKDNIQSAMVYPALLTLVGGSAVIVLMMFVIPKFAQIFSDVGQTIPAPTALLMALSSFLTDYWWGILFFIILSCYIGRLHIRTPEGKFLWDKIILRTPLLGKLVRKIEVSRFCRTLGTLTKSGVPILQSLIIVKEVINNELISRSMSNIHKGVKVGKGLSGPLKESNSMPPLATHMISIGEETGNLEDMLFKVADIYDKEVEVSIKKIISLIEPLMILLMGSIVGFIVFSMLIAILSINEIPF